MRNRILYFRGENEKVSDVIHGLSFREVDTLAKICEMAGYCHDRRDAEIACAMHYAFRRMLIRMNDMTPDSVTLDLDCYESQTGM